MRLYKIKFNFFFLALFFATSFLFSQNGFVVSGGNHSGNGGKLSFSIGQLVYKTQTGSNGSINQGVQQAYEIYTVDMDEEFLNMPISIFPNPTLDMLIVNIEDVESKKMNYQLFDLHGKLVGNNSIFKINTNISMENLPPSTYVLKINSENKPIQSFTIIKN